MKAPKVSVCVISYNQEKYIRKCLQSILEQETDFEFEVIVGDDGSKDGTPAIIREFADKYPGKVKPVLHPKNVGPTANYFSVHNIARGKYIAHVDGDDYCLPGKLSRLAAHLDQNKDCRIVWHRMHIINEHGQSAVGMPVVPISEVTGLTRLYAKDLATYYGITGCHSGSMYRASAKKLTERPVETLDYFFSLSFVIDGGYASYIDEPYGVYRFFSYENTITRAKGNVLAGKAKLSLIGDYLKTNPELRKQFAAQCLFEVLVRTYLRYPLKWAYLKMLLDCRSIPALSDLRLIAKVFQANRNRTLLQRFSEGTEVLKQA